MQNCGLQFEALKSNQPSGTKSTFFNKNIGETIFITKNLVRKTVITIGYSFTKGSIQMMDFQIFVDAMFLRFFLFHLSISRRFIFIVKIHFMQRFKHIINASSNQFVMLHIKPAIKTLARKIIQLTQTC